MLGDSGSLALLEDDRKRQLGNINCILKYLQTLDGDQQFSICRKSRVLFLFLKGYLGYCLPKAIWGILNFGDLTNFFLTHFLFIQENVLLSLIRPD